MLVEMSSIRGEDEAQAQVLGLLQPVEAAGLLRRPSRADRDSRERWMLTS